MNVDEDSGHAAEADAVSAPFHYEPGQTLYILPFTDADEEQAWVEAAERMQR